MSKQVLLLFVTYLLSSPLFAAGDHSQWWEKANELYSNEQYDSAAQYYERIAKKTPDNAEVYYNLGNAYYRLNNIGKAALNYERALKYKPGHKQASDNLYLTQSRITNRIQPVPEIFFLRWWRSITQSSFANTYAVIALIFFLLVIGYHIARRAGYIQKNYPVQLSIALLAIAALFITLSLVAGGRKTTNKFAIIMKEAPLMAKPEYGSSKSRIPEGTKVDICGKKSSWYEVTLPDGRTGWIQNTLIEKI